jgi:hypothetical protein
MTVIGGTFQNWTNILIFSLRSPAISRRTAKARNGSHFWNAECWHWLRSNSPDMALRLVAWPGTSAESWLKMQTAYDLWRAEQKPRPVIHPAQAYSNPCMKVMRLLPVSP